MDNHGHERDGNCHGQFLASLVCGAGDASSYQGMAD
jgi:hypothetical protein